MYSLGWCIPEGMTLKTIKQHRKDFPQIYEVEINGETKFRLLARKVGYVGKKEERFDKLSEAKDRATEIASKIKSVGLAEAAITQEDRYWILKGRDADTLQRHLPRMFQPRSCVSKRKTVARVTFNSW